MRLFFFFPVARQTENTGPHTVTGVVVKTYFYIFFHCQFVKQTDILERTGDARLIYLHGIHPGSVFSVQQNRSPGRLIYLSQQIEYRRLSRSVGTDQPRDLRSAHYQIEIIYRGQPAEIDSEMARLQNGRFADITASGMMPSLGIGTILSLSFIRITSLSGRSSRFSVLSEAARQPLNGILQRRIICSQHDENQYNSVDEHTIIVEAPENFRQKRQDHCRDN